MEAPGELRTAASKREDMTISHREYEDGESVVAIDFGPGVEASVDVVGDVAIVVAGHRQYEFQLPPEATDVTTSDGLLLIESG